MLSIFRTVSLQFLAESMFNTLHPANEASQGLISEANVSPDAEALGPQSTSFLFAPRPAAIGF